MDAARVGARQEASVRADPVLEDDPPAAAKASFATALVAQRESLDVHAVARLGDLGRAVVRVSVEATEHGAVPVPGRAAAPPAQLRLDDREVASGFGMPSADEGSADRGEASRR